MDSFLSKYGYCYVAINLGGDANARKSALSLRAYDRTSYITLFTDQSVIPSVFNNIVKVDSFDPDPVLRKFPHYPEQGIFAKASLVAQAPYEYCIFSDYDVHFCGDISDTFKLLEEGEFDFVAPYDSGEVSLSYLYPDVPYPMVKFHLGVFAWHNTPKMQAFFSTWRKELIAMVGRGIAGGAVDEWTFSRAAYLHKDIRWSVLPSTYCCRFIFPYNVRDKVKALHGRSEDYEKIERDINASNGLRVGYEGGIIGEYVPGVGFRRL